MVMQMAMVPNRLGVHVYALGRDQCVGPKASAPMVLLWRAVHDDI